MKKNETEEYSIVTLLQKLAEDKLESRMIEVLSKNLTTEEALKQLLKAVNEEQL